MASNNPFLYPDSPLSAEANARLRAEIDRGDEQARSNAQRSAADRAAAEVAVGVQLRERNANALKTMQESQRAALKGSSK